MLTQGYNKNRQQLNEQLLAIDRGLIYLSNHEKQLVPLPILGSVVARDLHYFDLNHGAGKLLLAVLAKGQGRAYPKNVEEINQVLNAQKIIRDEISNSTSCYGLVGQYGDQKAPWEWFWKMGQPLQLTLANLQGLTEVEGHKKQVFIVENPSVFLELVKRLNNQPVSLICTSGQLNSSSWMLLDQLARNGNQLYYHGDYDPEGLQIADKIKQRYENQISLCGYRVNWYEKSLSKVDIGGRLGKLETIQSKELKEVAKEMKHSEMAGYQELLIEELVVEIGKIFSQSYF